MYYFPLTNSGNHTLSDFNTSYTYGDSYTDNGNGTYSINNPTTIYRSDWYNEYSNINNKYVCKDYYKYLKINGSHITHFLWERNTFINHMVLFLHVHIRF